MGLSNYEKEQLKKIKEEIQKLLDKDEKEKEPDYVDYGSRERSRW